MRKLKITFNAPVTLTFSLICLVATSLGMLFGEKFTQLFFVTYHSSLSNPMTYVRLFTHVFGHGSWSHFLSNITYILLLGPLLEEKYGSTRILEVIGITAVVTGMVNYWLFPDAGLLGASGVVFAMILLASFTSFKAGEIPITFILVAVIFIGQQIYQGIFVQDQISNMAHIVGGIIGAVAGYFLNKTANDHEAE